MKKIDKQKLIAVSNILNSNGNGKHEPETETIVATIQKELEKEDIKNPFPIKSLPKEIAKTATEWADFYNLPCDFYVAAMLSAASATIGNKFRIQYTYDYTEPLMLWNVIVGAPGIGKTPTIKKAIRPLIDKQRQYTKDHRDEKVRYERNKDVGVTPNPKPLAKQTLIENATFEATIQVLEINPKGLLGFYDELKGFLQSLGAYKQNGGGDIENYLKIFNSADLFINRSSFDKPVHIVNPFIAKIAGIQPGVLHSLVDGGKFHSGYFQRLAFWYPENQSIPIPTDNIPSDKPDQMWASIIETLELLPSRFHTEGEPSVLKMHTNAFNFFFKYKTEKEQKVINQVEDENIKALHIKQLSYTLRLACIIELLQISIDNENDFISKQAPDYLEKNCTISKDSIEKAILISDYLTVNSLKVIAKTENAISALPKRQQSLYENLPLSISSANAKEIGKQIGISESTVKKLIYNPQLFKQQADGTYRKLFS
jgi:Protein of unknown function (DUF3987)